MTDELDMMQPPAAPTAVPAITGDATSIVAVVLSQLTESERRLGGKIDSNAHAALRRWNSHTEEHDELERQMSNLASEIREVGRSMTDHLQYERERQIVFDTRIGPLRSLWKFFTQDKRWAIIFGYIALQFLDDLWTFLHSTGLVS